MTSLSSFPTTVTITKYPQYSSYHFFFRHPLKTSSKDLRGIYFGREREEGRREVLLLSFSYTWCLAFVGQDDGRDKRNKRKDKIPYRFYWKRGRRRWWGWRRMREHVVSTEEWEGGVASFHQLFFFDPIEAVPVHLLFVPYFFHYCFWPTSVSSSSSRYSPFLLVHRYLHHFCSTVISLSLDSLDRSSVERMSTCDDNNVCFTSCCEGGVTFFINNNCRLSICSNILGGKPCSGFSMRNVRVSRKEGREEGREEGWRGRKRWRMKRKQKNMNLKGKQVKCFWLQIPFHYWLMLLLLLPVSLLFSLQSLEYIVCLLPLHDDGAEKEEEKWIT